MIIRPGGTSQFLITQPDHAALAAHIMRQWADEGLRESSRRALILLAIEEHDNGWREVDATPIVDVETGRILDFVNAPADIRRGVWPRGVERLSGTPYAAALVAQHAVHIYRRFRADPDWTPFFGMMEAARDQHLRAVGTLTFDELLGDYSFLRLGDLASLTFCNGWTEVQEDDFGFAMRLDGACLVISPDPFAGRNVSIEVSARELPDRSFQSASDAEEAWAKAPTVTFTGTVSGR